MVTTFTNRTPPTLPDVLLWLYDQAYCAGANLPSEAPADQHLRELLATIAGRHRAECLAPRGWLDVPVLNDELPGWLLARCEREVALGDCTPPEGWGIAGWPV